MKKLLASRFRYPLFFLGLLVMETSGLLFKFAHLSEDGVVGMVVVGFAFFIFSIVLT